MIALPFSQALFIAAKLDHFTRVTGHRSGQFRAAGSYQGNAGMRGESFSSYPQRDPGTPGSRAVFNFYIYNNSDNSVSERVSS